MPVRSEACSTVIAQILPAASTSSTVFSSRSRVSATVPSRNSMYRVSVSAKYFIFMARSCDQRKHCGPSLRRLAEQPEGNDLPSRQFSPSVECAHQLAPLPARVVYRPLEPFIKNDSSVRALPDLEEVPGKSHATTVPKTLASFAMTPNVSVEWRPTSVARRAPQASEARLRPSARTRGWASPASLASVTARGTG